VNTNQFSALLAAQTMTSDKHTSWKVHKTIPDINQTAASSKSGTGNINTANSERNNAPLFTGHKQSA